MNIFFKKASLVSIPAAILAVAVAAGTVFGQDIMSFREYQEREHPEPYIYSIETNSGSLLYFGSRHSFDPADSQMERLERVWSLFNPDLVLTETKVSADTLSSREAIRRAGEFGLTAYLARREGVPLQSMDPDRGTEIEYLKEQGWSDEQLMLFFTLRQVAQSQDQQISVDLEKAIPQYLGSLTQRFGLRGPATLAQFEEAVARHLPHVDDWSAVSPSLFYPGPQTPSYFTNEISTGSNLFRDRYHVKRILEAVKRGKRVLVICGSAHAVMQESALRAGLKP